MRQDGGKEEKGNPLERGQNSHTSSRIQSSGGKQASGMDEGNEAAGSSQCVQGAAPLPKKYAPDTQLTSSIKPQLQTALSGAAAGTLAASLAASAALFNALTAAFSEHVACARKRVGSLSSPRCAGQAQRTRARVGAGKVS